MEMRVHNKRVLFVIPYMHEGGAQRALSNIQMHLPDAYEVDTLINSESGRAYPNKGRVISLNTSGGQFVAFFRRTAQLKQLKKTCDYKACVSFIDSANICNIFTKRYGRDKHTRTIISIRTSITEASKRFPQYRYIVRPIVRILYRKADLIVAVSEELSVELIRDFGFDRNRIVSIPNGFDLDGICRQAEEPIDREVDNRIRNRKVVFTAGRLNAAKNQWHLVRAFTRVKKNYPNTVLIIAGTGELDHYLKELIKKTDLTEDVILLGFEKNVYRYMKRADVFVLPSGFEGFPNALGEALCVGAPCIATDFKTGAREILAPELLFDGKKVDRAVECEYGMLTPVCSGIMYKGDEPLEHEEIELAGAIVRMISEKDLNGNYREKSKERGKSLDIRNATELWIKAIEG